MKTCDECRYFKRLYSEKEKGECCVDPPKITYVGSISPFDNYMNTSKHKGSLEANRGTRPVVYLDDPACSRGDDKP